MSLGICVGELLITPTNGYAACYTIMPYQDKAMKYKYPVRIVSCYMVRRKYELSLIALNPGLAR